MFGNPYETTRFSNYKVIIRSSVEDLEEDVNIHLANGYVLAGGVSRDQDRNYFQAVYIDPKQQ